MEYLIDYLDKYGGLDFNEKPFCEVDALIFAQLIYNDLKGIADFESEITLKEAAVKFYELYTDEQIDVLLDVAKRGAQLLTLTADTKRFSNVIITKFIDNINDTIDKQIAAANFLLSDGSLMISFRGTDATVAGFKESAMLTYMFPIPAQIEALHYFQESAMLHSGEVRACGHSKGGNLAIFAAVNCSNSLKKRIAGIYALDAPGFPEWFFERYDYKQIKRKVFVLNPQDSIIGRTLYMRRTPQIIMSSAKRMRQHNVGTWIINDDKLERAESYSADSDKYSNYLNELVVYIGDEDLEVFYDALAQAAMQLGVSDFYDLKNVDISLLTIFIDSIQTLNPEQKERFKALAKKVMTDVAKDYVSEYKKKARLYVKRVTSKISLKKTAE